MNYRTIDRGDSETRGANVDWNGDGKHDWQDDALYHNVIQSDDKEDKPSAQNSSSTKAGWSSFLSTLIPLAYLGLLIPGDIPINGFTMFIGFVCAGILAVKFLKWIYQ